MHFLSLKKLSLIAAAGAIAGLGLVAFASAHGGPPATGIIHSCVNNSSGEIKIVAEDATCNGNRSPLDWNAQGVPGEDGEDGADGQDGVSGWEIVQLSSDPTGVGTTVNGLTAIGLTIDCPDGKNVLGGGSQSNTDFVMTLESYPLTDTQWFVRHLNITADPIAGVIIDGYAICADVAP
jgi:hypothetical protein